MALVKLPVVKIQAIKQKRLESFYSEKKLSYFWHDIVNALLKLIINYYI